MIKPNKSAHLNRNNSKNQPPGPQGLSLIGSLVEYTFIPLEFLLKSAREYGDVVSLSIGPIRTYLFNHPNLIEEVLYTQNQNCIKDISYRVLKGVFGDGLLLSDGDLWKRHRRLIQPAFTAERIAGYASTIVADTAQMLEKWRPGKIYDIHQEMSQLTIKLITQAMFGVDVAETALEIGKALDTIMLHYVHQAKTWFLLPAWLPTPSNRKAHHATKRLNLPKLSYTTMVLKESMRLYPPAWILGRELTRDCTIGDDHLTRGTTIYLSQWVVHRDPRFFANPEQFLPERWENNLEQRLPRCAYFPFGAGPRVCIGKAFSMMEATLILAMIAQKFRLTLIPEHPIELLPSITLRPKYGVKMMLKAIT